MDAITIQTQVYPDIVIEKESYTYSNRKVRYSYIIYHQIIVAQELDNNGKPIQYSSIEYIACRLNNGKIEYLDRKNGWLVDEVATKLYIEKQAEDELLK